MNNSSICNVLLKVFQLNWMRISWEKAECFWLIYLAWADFLTVFSSYYFPHHSVFPIHLLSPLCSLSPIPLLQCHETFLPQKPVKKKKCHVALVVISLCNTEQSFSLLTDFLGFSESSAMSRQRWLTVTTLWHQTCAGWSSCCPFFAPSSHISAVSWKRNGSQSEYSKHLLAFERILRIIFLQLEPLFLTSFFP